MYCGASRKGWFEPSWTPGRYGCAGVRASISATDRNRLTDTRGSRRSRRPCMVITTSRQAGGWPFLSGGWTPSEPTRVACRGTLFAGVFALTTTSRADKVGTRERPWSAVEGERLVSRSTARSVRARCRMTRAPVAPLRGLRELCRLARSEHRFADPLGEAGVAGDGRKRIGAQPQDGRRRHGRPLWVCHRATVVARERGDDVAPDLGDQDAAGKRASVQDGGKPAQGNRVVRGRGTDQGVVGGEHGVD